MADYKPNLSERLGPDGPRALQSMLFAAGLSLFAGALAIGISLQLGATLRIAVVVGVGGTIIGALLIYAVLNIIPDSAGAALTAAMLPSGDSTPYKTDYSYESAMVMRGDVKGALASYEEKIKADPANAELKLRAADVYAGTGDAARARDLYREVQRMSGTGSRDDVFASYRLIDLYRGPLGEPGKSLPEFRRLIDRYPNSEISKRAGEALRNLKKEMTFD